MLEHLLVATYMYMRCMYIMTYFDGFPLYFGFFCSDQAGIPAVRSVIASAGGSWLDVAGPGTRTETDGPDTDCFVANDRFPSYAGSYVYCGLPWMPVGAHLVLRLSLLQRRENRWKFLDRRRLLPLRCVYVQSLVHEVRPVWRSAYEGLEWGGRWVVRRAIGPPPQGVYYFGSTI